MEVITERGISWQVARVYAGNRAEERRRKRQKKPSRWCPVCKGQPAIIESDRTALAAALAGSLGRVAP